MITKNFSRLIRNFSKYNEHVNVEVKKPPIATKADLSDINKKDLPLVKILQDEILDKGPITFSRYWDVALGHKEHGYYMKRDVFNTKGDFITSVEISQMFGEILGIWVINLLQSIKAIDLSDQNPQIDKKRFSLLEFGPGRGTLMCDILKVLHQFDLLKGIEINFVEMSPFLKKLQQEQVMKVLEDRGIYLTYDNYNEQNTENNEQEVQILSNEDPDNYVKVRWFSTYEQMMYEDFGQYSLNPDGNPLDSKLNEKARKFQPAPIAVIAHEFFDALPANIFQYVEGKGWREKLVNIAHGNQEGKQFEFFTADLENDNVKKILNPQKSFEGKEQDVKDGDTFEIQPKSAVIANAVSELIEKLNGGALFIDYGENHAFSDSIRGIRKHMFVPQEELLEYPGELDISAYVNFAHIQAAANQVPGITTAGPMPQGLFLESMGMNTRLENLLKLSNKQTAKRLESEYLRLVSPEEMGQVYKCFYIGKKINGDMFPFMSENAGNYYY
ncbi:hypothetical protein PPERSA_11204 [Pseudocohnilembus persalinus]|uniref:Protein arginine methyltransferase NDUFAF7 n=1 Tax=Pseudocohnilembus persalinus TaxID=266149 RepID=A0A0V0QZC0_PSEPJ|nr:hypothetical protein PPERSA_11204 [Pseudocohnilembus persalinus]|eukprot:KRX07655.1 hypothetical protein PPERSA_11204 [Pseudocohnilembus persalinus]